MDATNVMKAPDITELDLRPVRDCSLNKIADYHLSFGNQYDPVEHMLEFSVHGLETTRTIHKIGEVGFAQINFRVKVVRKPRMMVMKVLKMMKW